VNGRPLEVLDVLNRLPRRLRPVYEAGPTGYGSFVGHARSALRPSPEVLARINETVGQSLETSSSPTASGDAS
jgi:hypothetical protein